MRTYRGTVVFTNRSQWTFEAPAQNRAAFLVAMAGTMFAAGPSRRDPAAITIEPVGKAFRRFPVPGTETIPA